MASLGTITWWGCAAVELIIDGRCLVIDPYLQPARARAHYILITHEHYDHCHEPTLRKLTRKPAFQRLIVPRSCVCMSRLHSPVCDDASDLAFVPSDKLTVLSPKHTKLARRAYSGLTEIELDGLLIEAVESSEEASHYRTPGASPWFDPPGPRTGPGEFPSLGYVITHLSTGLTIYHPGDLTEAFDSQRELRGRVDYLFLPTVKVDGLELTVIDNIRPRYVIPIHYRSDTPDFPIPLNISQDAVTSVEFFTGNPLPSAENTVYEREIYSMVKAHWYPTTAWPMEHIAAIEDKIQGLAVMLVLDAGRRYEIEVP
jgi:L-ascorbate metabolism protein UlaG (beta-lactamase superfamily)